ncbi:hypothetical protein PhaeoP83_04131 (plasmid) [Phaeobacter inhibens]|uniref:Transposase n=1 Tax=Phaeobacter inhibens TaxID=221822 RepID=A0ABM6RK97_9RHOB|nr:hypothetical protein PhaeoP83_04131 [Phaeobacter inhibens]AUQ96954.1 hypothetical protein PhaeoP66_04228 [Phaeobacter inhibens]AUR22154.1 hypothetical protein PhaeoP80_04131 [Phaeobacter inhibens]
MRQRQLSTLCDRLYTARHRAVWGSLPTYGDAATGLQRIRTRTLLPDDARQPNSDIRTRPAMPSLQTRRIPPDFPRADLQASSAGQDDAAPRSKVRDAQIATFAKSADLVP